MVCVGDKSRAILSRLYAQNIMLVANEVGRKPPTFLDAAKLANAILNSGYDFNSGKIIYNKFKSVVSYTTADLPVFSLNSVKVLIKNSSENTTTINYDLKRKIKIVGELISSSQNDITLMDMPNCILLNKTVRLQYFRILKTCISVKIARLLEKFNGWFLFPKIRNFKVQILQFFGIFYRFLCP